MREFNSPTQTPRAEMEGGVVPQTILEAEGDGRKAEIQHGRSVSFISVILRWRLWKEKKKTKTTTLSWVCQSEVLAKS